MGCLSNLFSHEYFFNRRAMFPVPRWRSPIGHAHPHIALPETNPTNPNIARGKRRNAHFIPLSDSVNLYTLTSSGLRGQADVAEGQALQ